MVIALEVIRCGSRLCRQPQYSCCAYTTVVQSTRFHGDQQGLCAFDHQLHNIIKGTFRLHDAVPLMGAQAHCEPDSDPAIVCQERPGSRWVSGEASRSRHAALQPAGHWDISQTWLWGDVEGRWGGVRHCDPGGFCVEHDGLLFDTLY